MAGRSTALPRSPALEARHAHSNFCHRCCLLADFALIGRSILRICYIRVLLRRVIGVGVVQQVLDAEKELLDSDGGLPVCGGGKGRLDEPCRQIQHEQLTFLFVENAEADSAAGVNVGVEEGWVELAPDRN